MKDKHWELGRRILVGGAACVLTVGIFLGTGSAQVGDETRVLEAAPAASPVPAEAETKDEIVYATLSATGVLENVYVVNHFVTPAGTQITDYGDYSEVVNLTDTQPLILDDGSVTFVADSDSFYYQGNLEHPVLPWDFEVEYRLDGKTISPKELAGRSGKLKILIHSVADPSALSVFSDNYMLQIQVTLDSALAKNIKAPGGTPAAAGANQVIAYTVLPGSSADYTLEADVENFEMAGISITGMPYAMEIDFPDIGDSLSDLEKLPEAIGQLNDGIGELENGTLNMRNGTAELKRGSASIKSGLSMLSSGGSSLKSGSRQIQQALNTISSSMAASGLDEIDLSSVKALPESLGRLKSGLEGLSEGLLSLQGGFGQAYEALDSAISGIPDPSVSSEAIEGVMSRLEDPTDMAVVGALAENYQAAQTVRGTYGQVKQAFAAVEPAIAEISSGLDQMSAQLGDSLSSMEDQLSQLDGLSKLSQLKNGLEELADNYGDFNSGLSSYVSGVSELADNYSTFDAGISSLTSGVGQLHEGVGQLHEGTSELNAEIADLPDMIQDEIDKMKEEFMPSAFEPVSFTSNENKNTDFVQFVMQLAPIETEDSDEDSDDAATESEETFWDRLGALFS